MTVFPCTARIWLYQRPVDMRRSFDGLGCGLDQAGMEQEKTKQRIDEELGRPAQILISAIIAAN